MSEGKELVRTTLQFLRTTPGTHLYKNTDVGAAVKSIYVQRDGMEPTPPKRIVVTVYDPDAPE